MICFLSAIFLFYCQIFPIFALFQLTATIRASPFIHPYPPLSPPIPTKPESGFCHPCTFAPSFKAQRCAKREERKLAFSPEPKQCQRS